MTGIYVAFRRTAPVGAPWWQRALSALVRWRLVCAAMKGEHDATTN